MALVEIEGGLVPSDDVHLSEVRADLARLALEVRAARHEVQAVESQATPDALLDAQTRVLDEVRRHLDVRRQQQAAELGHARTDAALLVAHARAQAAALINDANQEVLGTVDIAGSLAATVPATRYLAMAPPTAAVPLATQPVPVPVIPVGAASLGGYVLAEHVQVAPAAVTPVPRERHRFWSNVLYADVVLPLVAVLLVLTVLVAWVG